MKRLLPCLLIATLAACQSFTPFAPSAADQILGSWRTEVGGLELVSTFTADSVALAGAEPVAYSLEGVTLSFKTAGSHAFEIQFTDADTMVLTDQVTQTRQVYERVPN